MYTQYRELGGKPSEYLITYCYITTIKRGKYACLIVLKGVQRKRDLVSTEIVDRLLKWKN